MYEPFTSLADQGDGFDEEVLRSAFIEELKDELAGGEKAGAVFEDVRTAFEGLELLELSSEIVRTIKAECDADDFHNWDYDHLEFIIDLSNRHGFTIPRNLLNGLPEQLIILVDAKKLGEPGCD
jgi:hypothetical protein